MRDLGAFKQKTVTPSSTTWACSAARNVAVRSIFVAVLSVASMVAVPGCGDAPPLGGGPLLGARDAGPAGDGGALPLDSDLGGRAGSDGAGGDRRDVTDRVVEDGGVDARTPGDAIGTPGDADPLGGVDAPPPLQDAAVGGADVRGDPDGGGETDSSPSDARPTLDAVIANLRADTEAAMERLERTPGWPVELADGRWLVVERSAALRHVAGDFSGWAPQEMVRDDAGFAWLAFEAPAGSRYKLTDGELWRADPHARAYWYDDFGEISIVGRVGRRLERFPSVAGEGVDPRTVRVLVPAGRVDRVLYAHDGQNLFSPAAPHGGWRLRSATPPGVLVVGIDSTERRFEDYTRVQDSRFDEPRGGGALDYLRFVHEVVRPLVREQYGESAPIGMMGSSLGGVVSLHALLEYSEEFDFIASLSGALNWGASGSDGPTIVERIRDGELPDVPLYLDSGGGATRCADLDGDWLPDIVVDGADAYCENRLLRDLLVSRGRVLGDDLFYLHVEGAEHDEAAWADRVGHVLEIFDDVSAR